MPQAIERSLATPMIRPCFPAISGIVFPIPSGLRDPTRRTAQGPIRARGRSRANGFLVQPVDRAASRFAKSERGGLNGRADRDGCGRQRVRRAAFRSTRLRRFVADGCFAASGALSYTTLVSLVPLAVIALGSLSAFPIFAPVREQLLALAFKNFVPSVGEQAAYWFRNFAEFGGPDNGDRRRRHRRDRYPAAGDGRGPAQPDLAGNRAPALGPAGTGLLGADHAGPVLVGVSLSLSTYFEIAARQAGFGPRRGIAGERLAARARARRSRAARIRRTDPALLSACRIARCAGATARSAR